MVLSLSHIRKISATGSKYEVSVVASEMTKEKETTCARFLEQVPLQVFAIACVFNLEGQARDAAKKQSKRNPSPIFPIPPNSINYAPAPTIDLSASVRRTSNRLPVSQTGRTVDPKVQNDCWPLKAR